MFVKLYKCTNSLIQYNQHSYKYKFVAVKLNSFVDWCTSFYSNFDRMRAVLGKLSMFILAHERIFLYAEML